MDANSELLDRREASAFLKISDRTLDRLSDLPRIKIGGRRVVFRRSDLLAYVDRRIEAAAQ